MLNSFDRLTSNKSSVQALTPARSLHMNRRGVIMSVLAAPLLHACKPGVTTVDIDFIPLENAMGGRLGIAAMDMSNGAVVTRRGFETFPFCSTFKWLLAAFTLAAVDKGDEDLDRLVMYKDSDVVFYSPLTKMKAGRGMTIRALCEAALQRSDNTAANLLTKELGGPEGLTALVRAAGDDVTRFDRWEPLLNQQERGERRDATSPVSMMELMKKFLFDKALEKDSREQLQDWMIGSRTGRDALRAGLPKDWRVGDKTGRNSFRSNHDVGFAIPPEDLEPSYGPIIIASYMDIDNPLTAKANAVHKQVAQLVVSAFSQEAQRAAEA